MATIDQIIKRTKKLNFKKILRESFEDTQSQLNQAQRDQMIHGINAEGERIGRYKDPNYARKKYAMNQKAGLGNVDLKFTGQFQSEVFTDIRDSSIVFSSSDNEPVNTGDGSIGKTDKLVEKYGGQIFGLSKEYSGQYVKDHLADTAQGKVNKILKEWYPVQLVLNLI